MSSAGDVPLIQSGVEPGVWSPRASQGGGAPMAGSESPVTQYVAPETAALHPAPAKPRPRQGLLACFGCCFRDEAELPAPSGGPDWSPSTPRPLYIPPAPHVGKPFIPPLLERDIGKKTLVLDLDETLVHSSFKPVPNPDYIIPVEIDGKARRRAGSSLTAPPPRAGAERRPRAR